MEKIDNIRSWKPFSIDRSISYVFVYISIINVDRKTLRHFTPSEIVSNHFVTPQAYHLTTHEIISSIFINST